MDKQMLINFLKHTPYLSEETARKIAEQFEYREISKSDKFIKAGRAADEYLFLESGFIRSYLFDIEGNEITINFYGPNEVVFEVASFFQRQPSQENFEAITDCMGWVL